LKGSGPAAWRPQRSRLRLFPPEMERNFHVKPLSAEDRYHEANRTWEFSWELRPRRLGVKRIPALQLAYYDPTYRKYQTVLGPAIPLKVKLRAQARPPQELVRPAQSAQYLYELATGPEVLRRQGPGWPALPALVGLILVPPLLCACWYVLW